MEKDRDFLISRINVSISKLTGLDYDKAVDFASHVRNLKRTGNKIIFIGNGASNTIANHASLDYMSQTGVQTLSVNDPAILTAFSNDFGYEGALKRYCQMMFNPGDMLVAISSSGNSPNVVNAAEYAKGLGNVVAFTGFDKKNALNDIADQSFWVDSDLYNVVESIHNLWLAMVCDLLASWMGDKVGTHGIEFNES